MRFAWHYYHEVLLEPIEPGRTLLGRQVDIRVSKPQEEQAVRLRRLRMVRRRLPEAFVKAVKKYDAEGRTLYGSRIAYLARKIGVVADILAIHRQDCGADCPWRSRGGRSLYGNLFAGRKRKPRTW